MKRIKDKEGVDVSLSSGSSTDLISPIPRPVLASYSHPSSLGPFGSSGLDRQQRQQPLQPPSPFNLTTPRNIRYCTAQLTMFFLSLKIPKWIRNLFNFLDTSMIELRIKVANPDDPEPSISLYVEDQSDPAMQLVSEMMTLCREVLATFGLHNSIPLAYKGQAQSNISSPTFSHLPEGPVRSAAYVKIMHAAEMDFRNLIHHGILGVPGYVQFTSPIRRYVDLLAHY